MSGELAAGQLVDERYTLEEARHQGDVQTVWRAWDRGLVRTVCLREVRLPSDDPDRRRQALRAARAAIRLVSPYAIPVYDAILDGDRLLVVTEWAPLRSLADVLQRKKRLPVKRVAAIGVDVLGALSAAHARGVVHGAVSPSVILMPEEEPCRLDGFGLSPPFDDAESVGWATAAGTAPFLAPEQVRREGSLPASDLWSLGATLYFAVEGVQAFGEPDLDHEAAAARPPRRAGRLQPVLEPLLATDPDERPAVDEVRRQLAEVAGVPLSDAPKETRRGRRRRRAEPEEQPAVDEELEAVDPDHDWDAVIYGSSATPQGQAAASASPDGDGWVTWGPPAEPGAAAAAAGPAAPTPAGASAVPAASADEPEQPRRYRSTPSWPPPPRPHLVAGLLSVLVAVVLVALLISNGYIDPDVRFRKSSSASQPAPELRTDPAAVPPDWIVHREARADYGISYPPRWTLRHEGNTLAIRDPATGAELRIEHRRPPGNIPPQDRWLELEKSFVVGHPDYRRLQLSPATYRGQRAALWEYTFSERGTAFHAVDLGVLTKRYRFALHFQAPVAAWDQMLPLVSGFLSSFQPPR
jgi:serine/threonine protein kinase